MGLLDLVLGPMVVGTAVSVFLCGILLTQIYQYYIRYPSDPTWMKLMVAYLLVTDLAHTGIEMAVIYQYTVTYFGNFPQIQIANALFSAIPVMSVSISSVAQCFFAWRVGRLTRLHWLGWAIALFAGVQFLCGIGVTIGVVKVQFFVDFIKFQGVVVPWLASSVVCDILITCSLVWYLQTNKSGIPVTDDLVTRLIRATVQTGAITALWAILDLIVYLTEDNSLHLIFNLPLAKIYTNSLMSTLNARRAHFDGTTLAAASNPTKVTGTTSLPTWERGYSSKAETYTHTQIHHDVMGVNITRSTVKDNNGFEDYELQRKARSSLDMS